MKTAKSGNQPLDSADWEHALYLCYTNTSALSHQRRLQTEIQIQELVGGEDLNPRPYGPEPSGVGSSFRTCPRPQTCDRRRQGRQLTSEPVALSLRP